MVPGTASLTARTCQVYRVFLVRFATVAVVLFPASDQSPLVPSRYW